MAIADALAITHPGKILDELLRKEGRRVGWLAKELGTTSQRLKRIRDCEPGSQLTADEALKLADIFRVPVETFGSSRVDVAS